MKKINLFSGRKSKVLAAKIAESLGVNLCNVKFNTFSDGEFQPSIEESIRGEDVYIVQSTQQPVDNLFELLLLIDAAKRASAKNIIAIIPYFGFARQDRKDKPRVPIASKLVSNLLSAAGITRIMTMDLHADQIQGFFEVPVDHLYASTVIIPYLNQLNISNLVVASPDMGGSKRANTYAKFLKSDVAICYKKRKEANQIEDMQMIGDVEGKNVILVDDMIDTAGTIIRATHLMLEKGAKDVRAVATHAVFSADSVERLRDSPIKEVIITDTLPLKHKLDKITVISISDLFSKVINKVINHESISSEFLY